MLFVCQILRPLQGQEGAGGGRDEDQDEDGASIQGAGEVCVSPHPPRDELQTIVAEEARGTDAQETGAVQRLTVEISQSVQRLTIETSQSVVTLHIVSTIGGTWLLEHCNDLTKSLRNCTQQGCIDVSKQF